MDSKDIVWRELFFNAAIAANCLPSSFVDGNQHVIAAIRDLRATRAEHIETARRTIIAMLQGYAESYESMARVARKEGQTLTANHYATFAIDIRQNMLRFVEVLP
jgi:hypothetical protein